jgi:hypothetical protein
MPRKASKNFNASWAELIRSTLVQGGTGRPAGKGWKTVAEFAAEADPPLSRGRAGEILRRMRDQGRVECEKCKNGYHWHHFYRPVQ